MLNQQIAAKRIKELAKKQGITVKKLLTDCDIGVNTVGKMANGTDVTSQTLVKIADYLDVSVDFLLGREQKNNASEDDLRSVIVEKVRALTDEQARKLLVLLETLFSEAE